MLKNKSKKIEYIESLSLDDLRFELDKIHARSKEIQMLVEIRQGTPDDFLNDSLNVLEHDYDRLVEEYVLYKHYYDEKRLNKEL